MRTITEMHRVHKNALFLKSCRIYLISRWKYTLALNSLEWQPIIHISCYRTFGQWSKWLIVERTQVIDRQETTEYITVTVSKKSVRFTFALFWEQNGFNLVKTERLWAFMKPDFCFCALALSVLLDFSEVRGLKSPSGWLDLLRPIRAGGGLSWTHMNRN